MSAPAAESGSSPIEVQVTVSGKASDGEPQIVLLADGQPVGMGTVTAQHAKDEWETLIFSLPATTTPQRLGVGFLNGSTTTPNGRELYVASIKVSDGPTIYPPEGVYQAEASPQPSVGESLLSQRGVLAWDMATLKQQPDIKIEQSAKIENQEESAFQTASLGGSSGSGSGGGSGGGGGGGGGSAALASPASPADKSSSGGGSSGAGSSSSTSTQDISASTAATANSSSSTSSTTAATTGSASASTTTTTIAPTGPFMEMPAASLDDPCLPFIMPSTSTIFNSQKQIYAHYFYPLSWDNKAPAQDLYNTDYMKLTHGHLRQRPLGTTPSASDNWRVLNMQSEVRMAIARGITGFTVDVFHVPVATDNLPLILQAAHAVDSRFKIIVMPDLSSLANDPVSVRQIIESVADKPAAYHLPDGRLVVSCFNATLQTPEWWQNIFHQLSAEGIQVAFVPGFNGLMTTARGSSFAPISYGFSDWGAATMAAALKRQIDPSTSHSFNKIYMMGLLTQQYRQKLPKYWEAANSETFRDSWLSAINGGSDWTQIITWSDFTESGEVEPATDTTLSGSIGTGFYDLNAYYATWFLTGQPPSITHDVLYYFYRREATNATTTQETPAANGSADAPQNKIELLAFLTAPATLKITIAGRTYTQAAEAGMTSFEIPLLAGTPVFALSRNGADVFSFAGGIQIYDTNGLPTGFQDLTYWSGSGSKSGICSITVPAP